MFDIRLLFIELIIIFIGVFVNDVAFKSNRANHCALVILAKWRDESI